MMCKKDQATLSAQRTLASASNASNPLASNLLLPGSRDVASRSDEESSSLTGVSSLSHSRCGDSSCDSDNWSSGISDSKRLALFVHMGCLVPQKICSEFFLSDSFCPVCLKMLGLFFCYCQLPVNFRKFIF